MKSRIAFVITLTFLLYQDQTEARLRIIYDRMEPMEVSKQSKLVVLSYNIVPQNRSFFQAEFLCLEDLVSSKLKLSIQIFKCLVGEAPDTCEFLITLKPPNACLLINAEDSAWSAITGAFTPKLRCPLKKGKYVADKITFDSDKWNIFPLDLYHFKVIFKMYEGDILTLALDTQTHFIRIH